MDILKLEGINKKFHTHRVLEELCFTVPEHSVFGFIGQNGAGKTTTMKLILGLLKYESGSIEVCNEQVVYGSAKTNRHIGYLPDVPQFYSYMTPMEYLRLCGEVTGYDVRKIRKRSQELLGLVGLSNTNRRIGGFSRGMKQRLGIAQALFSEPRLLICDEPTSALDPVGRKEILDILIQVKGKTTVLFSTHILSDVERICDRIAVLHEGKIALEGPIEEIRSKHRKEELHVEFTCVQDADQFAGILTQQKETSAYQQEGTVVTIRTGDMDAVQLYVFQMLADHRLLPLKLEIVEPSLENLFLEVVKK